MFDRAFQVGDALNLREWSPTSQAYSGSEAMAWVTYISEPGTFGLPDTVGVLSIEVGSYGDCTCVGGSWCVIHGICRGCDRENDWVDPLCPLHA